MTPLNSIPCTAADDTPLCVRRDGATPPVVDELQRFLDLVPSRIADASHIDDDEILAV